MSWMCLECGEPNRTEWNKCHNCDALHTALAFAVLLRHHIYEFGFATNCSCGAPSIWTWEDYADHIETLVRGGSLSAYLTQEGHIGG